MIGGIAMIFSLLSSVVKALVLGAINVVSIFSLPVDLMKVLGAFASVGSWVIGSDLVVIFFGFVVWWYGVRFAFGLATFIWKMLPLT